jgi:hypothetical protein
VPEVATAWLRLVSCRLPYRRHLLAFALALTAPLSYAEGPSASPAPDPAPSPSPDPPTSILLSVQRAVDELPPEEEAPCKEAEHQQIPCFPAHVEASGPRYSVEESLRHIDSRGPRPPGPPTVPEMQPPASSPGRATVNLLSGDPVCAARSLVKLFKGRNDTYYVYLIVDPFGEHAAMYEKPIDPETYASAPGVSYELVGRFKGECEALRAYRQALRSVPVGKGASGPPDTADPAH